MKKGPAELKAIVNNKYSEIARQYRGRCCAPSCGCSPSDSFSEDYSSLPGHYADADLGLGCGLPTESARIRPGDAVLDLGSGAGNDVFVARRLVGESGRVIGVDMSEAMIQKARANNARLGYSNVEFRLGDIESLPVDEGSVDVVVSNCVLNLVPDKQLAFSEIFRVLRPGGQFSISDVVLNGVLPESLQNAAEMYAGCVSGAVLKDEYLSTVRNAGFQNIRVTKEKIIPLPDSTLRAYLSEGELAEFKNSGVRILSITVVAEKPGL